MQRSNFAFPAWADLAMRHVVSQRIYRFVFSPPSSLHLEAEARGEGSWQFFVVRPQVPDLEGYLALSLTCQAQKIGVMRFLFSRMDAELTIVSSALAGSIRFQDPHSIINGLRRLDIWLTPEMNTRSRCDLVAKINMDRQRWVINSRVDMELIEQNFPISGTVREMRAEKKLVQRIISKDLRKVCGNKEWRSALLARVMTVLDDAKWGYGILEGTDWTTDAVGWLNYVNLDEEDDEMEESEEEGEMEESEQDKMEQAGDEEDEDMKAEDSGELVEEADGEDVEMEEGGSSGSEGCEMSVDDVRDLYSEPRLSPSQDPSWPGLGEPPALRPSNDTAQCIKA